jgi:hypothetical protein
MAGKDLDDNRKIWKWSNNWNSWSWDNDPRKRIKKWWDTILQDPIDWKEVKPVEMPNGKA